MHLCFAPIFTVTLLVMSTVALPPSTHEVQADSHHKRGEFTSLLDRASELVAVKQHALPQVSEDSWLLLIKDFELAFTVLESQVTLPNPPNIYESLDQVYSEVVIPAFIGKRQATSLRSGIEPYEKVFNAPLRSPISIDYVFYKLIRGLRWKLLETELGRRVASNVFQEDIKETLGNIAFNNFIQGYIEWINQAIRGERLLGNSAATRKWFKNLEESELPLIVEARKMASGSGSP